jgi:hypothetical protein
MTQIDDSQDTRETSRLLGELDRALDESSVIRDLANKYQKLRDLERLTGPSQSTLMLRKEILRLENRLRIARA